MIFSLILLGAIQGLLEWLPISSQGNLSLLMIGVLNLSLEQAMDYAVFLHTGTMLAAIFYFRKRIYNLITNLPDYDFTSGSELDKVTTFLILSTILTGILGYFLYTNLRGSSFSGEVILGLIGLALIATGLIQKFSTLGGRKGLSDLSWYDGIILGLAQSLSAIPGLSRSGVTTSALLFRDYDTESALSLSFLMSIPAVLGAEVGLGVITGFSSINITYGILGITSSFLIGLATIHFLLKIARKVEFWKFCIFLGFVALVPFLTYL